MTEPKEWRPETGWRDNPDYCGKCTRITRRQSAIHAVQYLGGKCTCHPENELETINDDGEFITVQLRKMDCPDCMKQVHEELGI